MYGNLYDYIDELLRLQADAIEIALIIGALILLIKICVFYLIIKSAVYNGTKQALEESVTPRMLGLYDQIERNRNSQNRQQYQSNNYNNNAVNNQQ